MLVKPLFMLIYSPAGSSAADWLAVIWHGLPMDLSMAGYLSIVPCLLSGCMVWTSWRWPRIALRIYFALVALMVAVVVVLDLVLYRYWGFRLDSTPLFYFVSSPDAAMASAGGWQITAGVMAIVAVATGVYFLCDAAAGKPRPSARPLAASAIMLVSAGVLFIFIRGGVTVSTMNVSRAYFSQNRVLNHAAVNPAFSLLYSLSHSGDFGRQYRFMSDSEATEALGWLDRTCCADSARRELLAIERPDIYFVILESFSAHLLPSMGGENIADRLDSIASGGLVYTNFYASSFRTDRALPAILNSFPAQPSTSVMKYVDKAEHLPALSAVLRQNGYDAAYYYGGDVNFTNMKALLVNGGFDPIISDSDFPLRDKTGKWGVHDGVLFDRVLADVCATPPEASPKFLVVQTSSSHEPFDVPYVDSRYASDPQKNAFAYADSCLGAFVHGVVDSPRGGRALFVIVPDHLGAWPLGLESPLGRHHVPLVFAGPALARRAERDGTPGCQPDIAPTILAALGLDNSMFPYGHDLADSSLPHYAFFSEPGMAALVTETDTVAIECDADKTILCRGNDTDKAVKAVRAYLQKLYDTLSTL